MRADVQRIFAVAALHGSREKLLQIERSPHCFFRVIRCGTGKTKYSHYTLAVGRVQICTRIQQNFAGVPIKNLACLRDRSRF